MSLIAVQRACVEPRSRVSKHVDSNMLNCKKPPPFSRAASVETLSSCGLRTRSAGVMGVACPARGCQGRLVREYSDKALYDQLKFYETLFDVERAQMKVKG